MKRVFFSIIMVVSSMITVMGQAPGGFKYQAVIRDTEGNILNDQSVTLQIEIIQGSLTGMVCCSETYSTLTNQFGLVNLEVGSQDVTGFDTINWANGPYYISVDLNGNTMGSSALLSVPYALYAENSGGEGPWTLTGNDLYYNGGSVGIGDDSIDHSAVLELSSSEKGFLPPRMSYEELNAISDPADGLLVFCTDCMPVDSGALCMYMYGKWYTLSTNTLNPPSGPCPGIPTVEYEGVVYNTIQIGSQCWLKENLNVGTRIEGSLDQENNGIIEKYCYNDLEALCEIYGGIYQWEEIMKYSTVEGAQGICPEGWHIPTDEEWCNLTTYLDPSVDCNAIGLTGTVVGLKMKTKNGWNTGGNGTNESGFSGIPGGVRYPDYFDHLGNAGDFWSSTLQFNPGAYYWVLGAATDGIGHYIVNLSWKDGISVRCIKDE